MRLLVIPEDQTLDQYIVKPIISRCAEAAGITASVEILPDPRLRGASEALNSRVIEGIIDDNPMIDLFILVIDQDCNRDGHKEKAQAREREHPGKLLTCLAVEEVETWLLGLYSRQLACSWKEVRAECDPKERFAEPLLERLGTTTVGKGRKKAMRKLSGQWKGLLTRCPEIGDLTRRLRELAEPAT